MANTHSQTFLTKRKPIEKFTGFKYMKEIGVIHIVAIRNVSSQLSGKATNIV